MTSWRRIEYQLTMLGGTEDHIHGSMVDTDFLGLLLLLQVSLSLFLSHTSPSPLSLPPGRGRDKQDKTH